MSQIVFLNPAILHGNLHDCCEYSCCRNNGQKKKRRIVGCMTGRQHKVITFQLIEPKYIETLAPFSFECCSSCTSEFVPQITSKQWRCVRLRVRFFPSGQAQYNNKWISIWQNVILTTVPILQHPGLFATRHEIVHNWEKMLNNSIARVQFLFR